MGKQIVAIHPFPSQALAGGKFDEQFPALLSPVEAAANITSFKLVVANFLGNNKILIYKNIVGDLLKNYEAMMSICLPFLMYVYCCSLS